MLDGYIHPDFGLVADILRKQIPKSGIGGTALSVWHRGQCVVDIWGGTKDDQRTPWTADTMSLSFSTTKGIASLLLHILVDEGKCDYDDKVCQYWPEFAQNGKENITIRQLMCHEAGLYRIRDMIEDASEMLDWAHMVEVLEKSAPAFVPGTMHAYHGLTYGWLIGELVQRIENKSFADVLQERLVVPLGLDGAYCGLPDEELARKADLVMGKTSGDKKANRAPKSPEELEARFQRTRKVIRFLSFGKVDVDHSRAALMAKGTSNFDFNHKEVVQACIPAANGIFTARSLAKIYAAMAHDGEIEGTRILSPGAVDKINVIQNRTMDKAVIVPMRWRLGYHRIFDWFGPKSDGFGHAGFGGSGAFADPDRNLSLGLTLNSGVGTPMGDARVVMLMRAALKCADARQVV